MPDPSSNEIGPSRRRPVDKAYRSRRMRVIVPIYAIIMFGNLIWAIAGHDQQVISASILLAGAVLGLIRVRRPMDTWPDWLFEYKP